MPEARSLFPAGLQSKEKVVLSERELELEDLDLLSFFQGILTVNSLYYDEPLAKRLLQYFSLRDQDANIEFLKDIDIFNQNLPPIS